MRIKVVLAAMAFTVFGYTGTSAQEGCQPSNFSCSQMKTRCENICQNRPNPPRCNATCENAMPQCLATGLWNIRGGAACWNTQKRS